MADYINDTRGLRLFGFELRRAPKDDPNKKPSIVPAKDDDGAGYVTAGGSHYGQYISMDGDDSKDNAQLIMKYRGTSMHPECDAAPFRLGGRRAVRRGTRAPGLDAPDPPERPHAH